MNYISPRWPFEDFLIDFDRDFKGKRTRRPQTGAVVCRQRAIDRRRRRRKNRKKMHQKMRKQKR